MRILKAFGFGGIVFGAAFALAIVLPAGDALAADKVRVGKAVPFAFTFIPMEVGVEAGIWAKYDIEPEISGFGGDARMQQALTSNSIDFGLGSGPGMGFMAKGVPAMGVAAFAYEPRNISVVVSWDSPIKSVDDLKGKKIGVTTVGSLTDWLAMRIAMAKGWGPKGVTTVTLGGLEPMRAAIRTNQVDALMLATEVGYALEERQEAKNLINSADFVTDFHTHIIFATHRILNDKPDVVRRFVNGWFATIAYMNDNKDKVVEISSRVLKQEPRIMARAYDDAMKMLSKDGAFNQKAVEVLKESFVEMGILDHKPADDVLFTTRFVPAKP